MFYSGLDSWDDVLIWHYVAAVLTSVILIFTTLVFWARTRWNDWKHKPGADSVCSNKAELACLSNTLEESEDVDSDAVSDVSADESVSSQSAMKKPSAHVAEMVIEAAMTDEQRSREYEVRRKQLAEIFQLMKREADKFGDISLSEVEEQMRLYQG